MSCLSFLSFHCYVAVADADETRYPIDLTLECEMGFNQTGLMSCLVPMGLVTQMILLLMLMKLVTQMVLHLHLRSQWGLTTQMVLRSAFMILFCSYAHHSSYTSWSCFHIHMYHILHMLLKVFQLHHEFSIQHKVHKSNLNSHIQKRTSWSL